MQASDAFLTLAEFAIALAGFTSILVVFSRGGGEFREIDRIRIQNALWTSLGPAMLSLCPSALALLGMSGANLWRAASGMFFVHVVLFFAFSIPRIRALSDEDRAILGNRAMVYFVGSGSLVNLVVQPLNILGVLFPPNPGVLFAGLLLMLFNSVIIFVRIVFIRPTGEG